MMLFIFYFLPDRITKNAIKPTMASTIKMPTPIPALKIPAIASQELKEKDRNNNVNTVRKFIFFIFNVLVCLNIGYEKTLPVF